MAENTLETRIKQRCDTESNWNTNNPVLLKNEVGYIPDGRFKVGDGTSTWSALSYNKADPTTHTHTKSQITDFPSSLKNPYSLTLQGNGTTLTNGTYDGSAAKTVNITPSSIGAAASSHTHTKSQITDFPTSLKNPNAIDINGTTYDGSGKIDVDLLPFVVGTQTAATGSWTGNASTISALFDGLTIRYWLPYNGSGNATLNLTLADGTTTGAINCYYSGTTRLTTHYAAGNVITLTYRSGVSIAGSTTTYTGWWADANYDSVNTQIRVYREATTSTYNNDYPLLISRTLSSNISSTEGGYTFVYGMVGSNDTTPTVNVQTGEIKATKFTGALNGNASTATSATSATTATKLGTATLGSGTKPIYLSSGTATASSSTVGSSTKPVYMNAGTITAGTYTLGDICQYTAATAGTKDTWGKVPVIGGSDGVMEVGKYIDFHVEDGSTVDYDVRITANTTGLTLSGTTSGTFSGNLSGNASTSTKLSNQPISSSGSSNSGKYALLAEYKIASTYSGSNGVYSLTDLEGVGSGIFSIKFRSSSSITSVSGSIRWLSLNTTSYTSNLFLTKEDASDSTYTTIRLYWKAPSTYISPYISIIQEYRNCTLVSRPSTVSTYVDSMTGTTIATSSASSALSATKLGSSTVGSSTKPIYLNAGTATESTSTVGSTDTPVYLNAGTITSTGKSFSSYLPLAGGTMTGDLLFNDNIDISSSGSLSILGGSTLTNVDDSTSYPICTMNGGIFEFELANNKSISNPNKKSNYATRISYGGLYLYNGDSSPWFSISNTNKEIDIQKGTYFCCCNDLNMGPNSDALKNIYFSNLGNGTYYHNCKIYGGSGGSKTGIGLHDTQNSLSVWVYNDVDNIITSDSKLYKSSFSITKNTTYTSDVSSNTYSFPFLGLTVFNARFTAKAISAGTTATLGTIPSDNAPGSTTLPLNVWVNQGAVAVACGANIDTNGTISFYSSTDVTSGKYIYLSGVWFY